MLSSEKKESKFVEKPLSKIEVSRVIGKSKSAVGEWSRILEIEFNYHFEKNDSGDRRYYSHDINLLQQIENHIKNEKQKNVRNSIKLVLQDREMGRPLVVGKFSSQAGKKEEESAVSESSRDDVDDVFFQLRRLILTKSDIKDILTEIRQIGNQMRRLEEQYKRIEERMAFLERKNQ